VFASCSAVASLLFSPTCGELVEPCVAPEHTGLFEQGRLGGVLELGRCAERDSG
jgi:hypothetical protein